jgi:hypothetical protein
MYTYKILRSTLPSKGKYNCKIICNFPEEEFRCYNMENRIHPIIKTMRKYAWIFKTCVDVSYGIYKTSDSKQHEVKWTNNWYTNYISYKQSWLYQNSSITSFCN